MTQRKALILSHYFYPSRAIGARRMSELARHFRDSGWAVTVIAAEETDTASELLQGLENIEVLRVRPPDKLYQRYSRLRARRAPVATRKVAGEIAVPEVPRKRGLKDTLKRYYHSLEWVIDDRKLWSAIVLFKAIRRAERWDWVISSGPPMSMHVAARLLASLTGMRWAMDLRDPWVGTGHWNDSVQTPLREAADRFFESACIKRADRVITASPGISAALVRRFPKAVSKVHTVYNGFDGHFDARRSGASGQLRLLYAGSLYYNRNPFPLMDAVAALVADASVDRSKVRLTLVGDCERWNGIGVAQAANQLGIGDCVRVLPPVSPAQVKTMIAESEVLINFAQGQPTQIPAKFYEHIASEREMILITEKESDCAKIARGTGRARIVEPGDENGLRALIHELYSFYVRQRKTFRPSREAIAVYSREAQSRRFLELLSVERNTA